MPAHKSSDDAGGLKLSNGQPLTELDRICNDEADKLAKQAARRHKVPDEIITDIEAQEALVEQTARLIAEMPWAANHQSMETLRDTDASRAAAAQAVLRKSHTAPPKRGKRKKVVELRPPSLGGHRLQDQGGGWRCTVCKLQCRTWKKLAPKECMGSAARKWTEQAKRHAEFGVMTGESQAFSGDVLWCTQCGSYADNVAKGTSKPCQGHPNRLTVRCVEALKCGRHPRTGTFLGRPQHEKTNANSKWQRAVAADNTTITEASNLEGRSMKRKYDNNGPTTAERREALLSRVRAQEAVAKALVMEPSQVVPLRRRVSGKRKLSQPQELAFKLRRLQDG